MPAIAVYLREQLQIYVGAGILHQPRPCVDLQDYDSFKRGKAKEIMFLKKDSRRAETEMRRLAMLNQKQKSVLQRKIQEAEEAKKRLQSLKQRGAKRANTSAPTNGSTAPPRPVSVSSSRGGSSHPSVTPFGASSSTGNGGAGGGWSAPGGAPAMVAGEPSLSMPPLGDGRDPKDWLRDEIEAASTAHYTRVVMQGTVAKRSDLSKRVKECERKIAEIDHLPEKQQVRSARRIRNEYMLCMSLLAVVMFLACCE